MKSLNPLAPMYYNAFPLQSEEENIMYNSFCSDYNVRKIMTYVHFTSLGLSSPTEREFQTEDLLICSYKIARL